jgi:uncharacterized protein (TIGR04255 family)
MRTYIPDIQERLRKNGYPRFQEAQMQQILLGSGSAPTVNLQSKWIFGDRDLKTTVVIAADSVTLETAEYDTFDVFADRMRRVLEVVGEIVAVDLAERLGLRYLDYIRPRAGDRVADYLSPGLAGIVAKDEFRNLTSRYLAQGASDVGRFLVRLTRSAGPFELPPDLQPADVDLSDLPDAEEWALLDVDHFSTASLQYRPDAIVEALWDLHDVVDGLFRDSVTPHAFEAWAAEPRKLDQ